MDHQTNSLRAAHPSIYHPHLIVFLLSFILFYSKHYHVCNQSFHPFSISVTIIRKIAIVTLLLGNTQNFRQHFCLLCNIFQESLEGKKISNIDNVVISITKHKWIFMSRNLGAAFTMSLIWVKMDKEAMKAIWCCIFLVRIINVIMLEGNQAPHNKGA